MLQQQMMYGDVPTKEWMDSMREVTHTLFSSSSSLQMPLKIQALHLWTVASGSMYMTDHHPGLLLNKEGLKE